jgi:hypothetical protein
MKNTEELLKQARGIISKQHLFCAHKTDFKSKTTKKLRRFFMLACSAELGAPFTSRIAGCMASE